MKIFSIIRRYFYSIIIINLFFIPQFEYAQDQDSYAKNNKAMKDITSSLDILRDIIPKHEYEDDVAVTLRIIRELHNEIENVSHWFDSDLLMHVVTSLVEMYRKVVEITLIYYVVPGGLSQKEFHNKIIKVISQDITKIIDYLCREFINSIFNEELSWQERICHCAWILSIILIIKASIEEMPYIFNFEHTRRNITNKISEITRCLKVKIDVSK
jgi:hypothetical protein